MKTTTTLLTAALILAASAALAQDATQTRQPAAGAEEAATPAPLALRAEMHRATAALLDARAAEKPDPAEIAKLTERVRTLRQQIAAQSPGPRAGYAQGGPGRGYGRGPEYGAGYGPGRGRGYGPGWGGRGYGRGYGAGYCGGYGGGYGAGFGPGMGQGLGAGVSPWFIDENGDGICDRHQPPARKQK